MKKIYLFSLLLLLLVSVASAQNQTEKISKSIIKIDGKSYYVHTVLAGETRYSIAKLYGVEVADLVANNPATVEILSVGQLLKIPKADKHKSFLGSSDSKRNMIEHTVNPGETLFSIARRYQISINNLMEDNSDLDPSSLKIGQKIKIRKADAGKTNDKQIEQQINTYRENLDKLTDGFIHHIVEKGETLYSLSKKYGVSVEHIRKLNTNVLADDLKMGTIIRLPEKGQAVTTPKIKIPKPNLPKVVEQIKPENSAVITNIKEEKQLKYINHNQPLNVALMLPFTNVDRENSSFTEFYHGFLVALDKLKSEGVSVNLNVINTDRSPEKIAKIIANGELKDVDLIIGPVYEETFDVVADYAAQNGVPIVSPLAPVTANNKFVFQVAPKAEYKLAKLREITEIDRNIIIIRPDSEIDNELEDEIEAVLPSTTPVIRYSRNTGAGSIESKLSTQKENLIIILSSKENQIDEILARISSIQNNISSRGMTTPIISVLGSHKWSKFNNIDKNLYFKLNVTYVTNFHADRSDESVLNFDSEYIRLFYSLPSPYSYRGYDIGMMFVGTLAQDKEPFMTAIQLNTHKYLQIPYSFEQKTRNGKFENNKWIAVGFKHNYTIEVF